MIDLRQSAQYGKYLQVLGWQTEKIEKCQIFIKKIPFLIVIMGLSQISLTTIISFSTTFLTIHKVSIEHSNVIMGIIQIMGIVGRRYLFLVGVVLGLNGMYMLGLWKFIIIHFMLEHVI